MILLFSVCPTGVFDFTAGAETVSGTCGDNLTWEYDTSTCTLTISGAGTMTHYSSSKYNGTWATSAPWGSYYNTMKTVVINSGVTSIGSYSFYRCTGLTSITIPDSVTSICNSAFSGCTSLNKVNISDIAAWCNISFNYYDLNSNPLYYAHNLYLNGELVTDLVIPDGVTSIGNYAFDGCTGLTSITIPDSVTSLGTGVFSYCTGLTSVTIPDSVTSIGGYAFSGCTGLTSITIPDSVTSIEGGTFSDCTGLKNITIPDSVTSIGAWAFYCCTGLTSITIPDSVTSIGSYAFYRCTGLTSVTIPDSVTSIGGVAFSYCTGLTSITIPDSVTSIGNAFSDCTGLTSITIPDSVTSIGGYAFSGCTGLTSTTIPDSVTSIGDSAFRGCTGLTSITIPDSVTSIGDYAFYNCTGLNTVYYSGSREQRNKIEIGSNNDSLTRANWMYNYVDVAASVDVYRYLADNYPDYLDNFAYNGYFSSCQSICNDVIQEYNDADNKILSFAESFINGTSIIVQNLFAGLGIGQSIEEEWLEKNALEYIKRLQSSEYIVSESWKGVEKKYKDFKFAIKSIDIADSAILERTKYNFIKSISDRSSCFSEAEATKLADKLIKKKPNGISNFFTKVDYAVDLADILLYSCQMLDAEVSSLQILKNNIGSNTPLYHAIEDRIMVIKADPTGYVVEKYLTDEITKKISSFLDDFADWSAGVVTGSDVTVTAKVVRTLSKLLYEYIYDRLCGGVKIDEVYGAIIAYDFYATTTLSYVSLLSQLRNNKINGTPNSEELLQNFKFMFEARREALANYVDACIEISKHSDYRYLLNSNKTFIAEGSLSFDKYVNTCFRVFKNDLDKGIIVCNHIITHVANTTSPTCDTSGYSETVCDICGYEFLTDVTPSLGHSYNSNTVAPTCTQGGYTRYTCIRCGLSYTGNNVSALGHSYNSEIIAPTCTQEGYTRYTCVRCSSSYTGNFISEMVHSFLNGFCTCCGVWEKIAPYDLNGDTELNSSDLSVLVTGLVMNNKKSLLDCNGDGNVNILDLIKMKKEIANM